MRENKALGAPVAIATETFKCNFYLPLILHVETLQGNIQALSWKQANRKKALLCHGTAQGILTT